MSHTARLLPPPPSHRLQRSSRAPVPPSSLQETPVGMWRPPVVETQNQNILATKVPGTVKWFNIRNGHGFIHQMTPNDPTGVFVHQTAIKNDPQKDLRSAGEGETVEVNVAEGEEGADAPMCLARMHFLQKGVGRLLTCTVTDVASMADAMGHPVINTAEEEERGAAVKNMTPLPLTGSSGGAGVSCTAPVSPSVPAGFPPYHMGQTSDLHSQACLHPNRMQAGEIAEMKDEVPEGAVSGTSSSKSSLLSKVHKGPPHPRPAPAVGEAEGEESKQAARSKPGTCSPGMPAPYNC